MSSNDTADETTRHRLSSLRRHVSHRGGVPSSMNIEGNSEETQYPIPIRKARQDTIQHILTRTIYSASSEESTVTEVMRDVEDDDRHDARQRLISEDMVGRERMMSATVEGFDCEEGPIRQLEQLSLDRPAQVSDCFRATSCPKLPSLDTNPSRHHCNPSERSHRGIRRTRAFTEDCCDFDDGGARKVRSFKRSDSIRIDSIYGSSTQLDIPHDSRAITWIYWGDNLDRQSPFASAFQQHF